MVGILAILKAGAAYLPIDPGYPRERKLFLAGDSNLKLILTQAHHRQDVPFERMLNIDDDRVMGCSIQNPSWINTAEDLIYVIYTSGTTGRPKGALINHRSVVNLSQWLIGLIYGNEQMVTLLTASINFDSSVKQLFPPLLTGGTLVFISENKKRNPEHLLSEIIRHRVNILDITPSYLSYFLEELKEQSVVTKIRYTLAGGENLAQEDITLYNTLLGTQSRLINVYGVTEATVDSTAIMLTADTTCDSIIGKPICNNRIYILDHRRMLVPPGVVGEICIAGEGLARGYLNDDILTKTKFIDHPYEPGMKLYCTGDVGRWTADGNVQFLGRRDNQVKIRGHRIEPGEIEKVLRNYEGIQGAAALVKKDTGGVAHLVAYYTGNEPVEALALRTWLEQHLPGYIVPAFLIFVDKFPLTVNGKLDVKNLPDPVFTVAEPVDCEPQNNTEMIVLDAWKKILGRATFSATDNFFNVGGNSLKVIQLYKTLQYTYPGILEVHDFFSHTSIRSQAGLLNQRVHEDTPIQQSKIVTIEF